MHIWLNVFHLGVKELRSLGRDKVMMVLILFAFTVQVYLTATGLPESLHKAPIAIVDEDHSQLSTRIINAFIRLTSWRRRSSINMPWTPAWMPASIPSSSTSRPISSVTCWLDGHPRSSSMSMPRACPSPSSATAMCRASSTAKWRHSCRGIARSRLCRPNSRCVRASTRT